jgi:hypothetical protein
MRIIPSLVVLLALPVSSFAASDKDIDSMTTIATMYGRAIGCGIAPDSMGQEIGKWFDRHFPKGTEQATYMPIFMAGIKKNAQAQHEGASPDSCGDVALFFKSPEYKQIIAQ